MYCVVDTERIHGNEIYLLSYQLYGEDFTLVESKTYQDTSINLEYRKSPRRKVELLKEQSIKVSSFSMLYKMIREKLQSCLLVVFSRTDVNIFRSNCKANDIQYDKLHIIDLQKILYDLSTDAKHKSNLKDYCKAHGIKHEPHIPESDCFATMKVYRNLLASLGAEFLESKIETI